MPGMGGSSGAGATTVVNAFHRALASQGAVILIIGALLFVAWNQLRSLQYRRAVSRGEPYPPPPSRHVPEPAARRFVRLVFGGLWIMDGLLQIQPAMPAGLPGDVLRPAASTSPVWVQDVVGWGANVWARHPATAAASAVWIELGIGALLLVAPRGTASRLAGVISAAWGLLVWVFGGAFGAIFAPGLTILFGAPGASLLYALAGVLIALPEGSWAVRRTARILNGALGGFLVGMAVLQAWPGRGFWQGSVGGRPGVLATMAGSMAGVSQPRPLSSLVTSFASFDQAHGWGVNLFAVVALAAIGTGLIAGGRWLRPAVVALVIVGLADWILIEDWGVWGGTSTDPNSMLPLLALAVTGYLAATRSPSAVEGAVEGAAEGAAEGAVVTAPGVGAPEPTETPDSAEPEPVPVPAATGVSSDRRWWERIDSPTAGRAAAALGALAVLLIGVAPMAAASVDHSTDPAAALALVGPPQVVSGPAPGFSLVDASGRHVSLASLRGKAVVLTFLDPVCTTDCPIIAQQLRASDALLGASASRVEYVAVVANRIYRSAQAMVSFDHQEGLDTLPNWTFVTGSEADLSAVWDAYGIGVQTVAGGGMVAHSDTVYIIGPDGQLRRILNADITGGDAMARASFAALVAQQVNEVLGS